MNEGPTDVTRLLLDWCSGDEQALAQLMPLVYDELHRRAESYMRRERKDHTLQPTALVHEAFLQLIDQNRVRWQNRTQFFAVAAQLMRRIVLKHARSHRADKRGGKSIKVTFDEAAVTTEKTAADLVALDEALDRLTSFDPRQGRIVELRYFGGLTVEEVAECLELSTATVKRETRIARAWLQREMTRAAGAPA
ncbi:MAG: sigma-70 family RNA polymerase sigma factor [bacterium]|nr:sigma-70 family RNA polymerase sigma factor [bacterium]